MNIRACGGTREGSVCVRRGGVGAADTNGYITVTTEARYNPFMRPRLSQKFISLVHSFTYSLIHSHVHRRELWLGSGPPACATPLTTTG